MSFWIAYAIFLLVALTAAYIADRSGRRAERDGGHRPTPTRGRHRAPRGSKPN